MDEHVRIKQILPITEGFAVLTLGEDENGLHCFHDSAKDGWHYLFALVDGGKDALETVAEHDVGVGKQLLAGQLGKGPLHALTSHGNALGEQTLCCLQRLLNLLRNQ